MEMPNIRKRMEGRMAINVLIWYVGEEIDQGPTGYDKGGWISAGTPSFFLDKNKIRALPAMMALPGHGGASD
ncbi:hypothetical protein [Methanoregula sp.]|uniref:hypothetical protein n=1 Tax=Methanoregula sp. TaxID=2052170 RepID=UPI003BAF1819